MFENVLKDIQCIKLNKKGFKFLFYKIFLGQCQEFPDSSWIRPRLYHHAVWESSGGYIHNGLQVHTCRHYIFTTAFAHLIADIVYSHWIIGTNLWSLYIPLNYRYTLNCRHIVYSHWIIGTHLRTLYNVYAHRIIGTHLISDILYIHIKLKDTHLIADIIHSL